MFNNLNTGPQKKSKQEILLEDLDLKKGTEVDFVKRATIPGKTSNIPEGAHVQGKLDADVQMGQPVYLDTGKKITFNDVIKRPDGIIAFKTDSAVYELIMSLQPEFGNFGVMTGDLERDGYVAFNSNHSSNQDAFAVSKNRNLFAVADGVGSRSQSGALARFLTMKIAEEITDVLQLNQAWVTKKLKELQADQNFLKKYNKTGALIKEGASTTLAVVNRIAEREFQINILGDSPLYVIDQNGKIIQQYGADTAGQDMTPGSLGILPDGTINFKGAPIRKIIKINKGERIVMGSDYISDGLVTYDKHIQARITNLQKWKSEGGYYSMNGTYKARTEITDAERKTAEFIPWNQYIEQSLTETKTSLDLYYEAMNHSQEYLAKRNNNQQAVDRIADWKKIASRKLSDFLSIKSGEEFYKQATGPDAWKKDDATVVVIK